MRSRLTCRMPGPTASPACWPRRARPRSPIPGTRATAAGTTRSPLRTTSAVNLRKPSPRLRLRPAPIVAAAAVAPQVAVEEGVVARAGARSVVRRLRGAEDLHRVEMIGQDLRQIRRRQSPEAAIGPEAKVRNKFPCRRKPLREARHVVDGAEVDARALRL